MVENKHKIGEDRTKWTYFKVTKRIKDKYDNDKYKYNVNKNLF